MKPADQIKVIALAFMTIVLMIGVISYVSMKTTAAMASHGAGHSSTEHGDPVSNVDSMAQDQTHSAAGHEASQAGHKDGGSKDMPGDQGAHQPAADGKMAEHGDAKMADGKMAEHGDAKMADGKMAEHGDAKMAEHGAEGKMAEHGDAKPAAAGGNVEAGGKVFMAKTCATCHTVASVKATGTIGPKLDGLSKVAATRVTGKSAEEYIKESIESPAAFVVQGFQPMMPAGLKATMSEQEYKDLLAFLGSL